MIDLNEGFLTNGKDPVLTIFSAGHALHVFINGQLSGEQHNAGGLQNHNNTKVNLYEQSQRAGIIQILNELEYCMESLYQDIIE